MLYTVMDVGKENQSVLKMAEFSSPQRSIRDFFISPQKDVVKKPKDLIGYFGTAQNKQNSPKDMTFNKPTVIGKTGTKRKKSDDIDDLNIEQKESGKKRRKKLPFDEQSGKNKKSVGKKNLEKESKTKSDVNGMVKLGGSENLPTNVGNTETVKVSDHDEAELTSGGAETLQGNDDTEKDFTHPSIEKSLRLPSNHKQTVAGENVCASDKSNSTEESVTEICYEDFIKTLNNPAANGDLPVNGCPESEKEDSCNAKLSEIDSETTVIEKQYPSVANFFTKINKSEQVEKKVDLKSQSLVTIKAIVHNKPVMQEETEETFSVKSPRSFSSTPGDEIEILGSEIVEVENILQEPTSKKKLFEDEKKEKSSDGRAQVTSVSEDSCMSEDSSICIVEVAEDVTQLEKKKSFLQSTSLPDVPAKTKQGTLSMFQMGNNKVKLTEQDKYSKCKEDNIAPTKKKPGRKPAATKTQVSKDSTPVKTPKRKVNKKQKEQEASDAKEDTDKAGSERRRSLRARYRVSLLEAQGGRNSPIRMKILRYSKSSTSGTDDADNFTPRSSKNSKKKNTGKLSRAKALLEKAKSKGSKKSKHKEDGKKRTKSSEISVSETSTGRRRSARLSGRHSSEGCEEEHVVIDLDEEEDDVKSAKTPKKSRVKGKATPIKGKATPVKGKATPVKGKATPVKGKATPIKGKATPVKGKATPVKGKATPVKGKATPIKGKATPSKKGTPGKQRNVPSKKGSKTLAPIFMKGKQETKPIVILDPEAEKLKRAFLMSGVPEELKRQTATVTAITLVEDPPPFPLDSHTQQKDPDACGRSGIKLWDLPDVTLSNSKQPLVMENKNVGWQKGLISSHDHCQDFTKIKKFKNHEKIDDASIEKILFEISSYCPTFPVRKMFGILKDKGEGFETIQEEQSDKKADNESATHEEAKAAKKAKKAVRRSLRRKRVSIELPDVIELGASPEPADSSEKNDSKVDVVPLMNLTEKYAPVHSSEVIGNTGKIKKLRTWMMEWKHQLDKEARKARKLAMKQNKGKSNKSENEEDDWWNEGDSDFDFDSEDETEDEDSLCNTVMLTGSSGIGKTATVYALAQELGFKVFEVNASSSRNGKKILSQLQEATQSHQVSGNKEGGQQTLKFTSSLSTGSKPLNNTKVPAAFSSFFKPANANKPTTPSKGLSAKSMSTLLKSVKETTKNDLVEEKKRKRNKTSDGQTPKKKQKHEKNRAKELKAVSAAAEEKSDNKGLNLSSTSLILFEEVDVVFESDHGFWAAVQHFMATTKIPIILTTSDSNLSSKFDGRFDLHKFKVPAYSSTTAYLQLVCLAEGVRTEYKEIYQQVLSYKGDIRQSLLSLQYWMYSGGAACRVKKGISNKLLQQSKEIVEENTKGQNSVQLSQIVDINDDDDDFVSIKPLCHRARVLSDDDSSNSMSLVPMVSTLPVGHTAQTEPETKGDNLPLVHLGSEQSLQQLPIQGCNNIVELLQKMIQTKDESLVSMASLACQQYISLQGSSPVYDNHTWLLPLPRSSASSLTLGITKKPVKKQRKRIKEFNLFDSEASEDESSKAESQDEENEVKKPELDPHQSQLCNVSLRNFFDYYDALSHTDSLAALCDRCDLSSDLVESGANLCSQLQVYSLRNLYNTHKNMDIKESSSDALCIPAQSNTLPVLSRHRSDSPVSKCCQNVKSNLPLGISNTDLNMDYFPTLRSVCKAEQVRKQAKVKRRFQHYLDGIGIPLKDTTLTVLCSTFE